MEKTQKFIKENQSLMISLAIIIVIIGLGLVFSKGKSNDDSKDTVNQSNTEEQTALEADSKPYVVKEVTSTPEPRLSYDDALAVYKDSRIQFGETCSATPFYSVQKNGATIMIDNRAKTPRAFTVGKIPYYAPAYDYTLVKLNYTNLPQTVYIDCGTQQNAATILVQE